MSQPSSTIPNIPQNAEFIDMVKDQIKRLENDNSEFGTFRRLMLTHSLHASARGEVFARKLASLEEQQKTQDACYLELSQAFNEFKTGRIAELESRIDKIEKKLLIVTGVLITIWALPQVVDVLKTLSK